MTALHWSVKRGYFELTYILIRYYSDINSLDIVII